MEHSFKWKKQNLLWNFGEILPKKHYLNMGELPKNLMDDLVSLINSLKDFLHNQYYKAVIVYENGTGYNAHTSAISVKM